VRRATDTFTTSANPVPIPHAQQPMDVTGSWRTAVSVAKRTPTAALPFSSSSSSSIHAAVAAVSSSFSSGPGGPPRGTVTDPFTQQAREVLESIRAKEEMLGRSRGHYVDAYRYVPSRASDMTEQERDQVDQVMASFIIKCGSQIEIIRCALAGEGDLTWVVGGFAFSSNLNLFCTPHRTQRKAPSRPAVAMPPLWAVAVPGWRITEVSCLTLPRYVDEMPRGVVG
jgi:enamine deaminase RidA (YjgF/YER057c/UK114 family)